MSDDIQPTIRIPLQPGQLAAEREHDFTSTDFVAWAGVDRFRTPGDIWFRKKYGSRPNHMPTAAMQRGTYLEPAVFRMLADKHPDLNTRPALEYVRSPGLRAGCTPDGYGTDADGRQFNLEIKTVSGFVHDEHWSNGAPPPAAALQTAFARLLCGTEYGLIAELVIDQFRFELNLHHVPPVASADERMLNEIKAFWRAIEEGQPPPFDYARDGALIALMYPKETEGSTIDLRHDNRLPELLTERAKLLAAIKENESRAEIIANEVKAKIGSYETALANGWRVTFKHQHRKSYTVPEQDYRVLRVKADATGGA